MLYNDTLHTHIHRTFEAFWSKQQPTYPFIDQSEVEQVQRRMRYPNKEC